MKALFCSAVGRTTAPPIHTLYTYRDYPFIHFVNTLYSSPCRGSGAVPTLLLFLSIEVSTPSRWLHLTSPIHQKPVFLIRTLSACLLVLTLCEVQVLPIQLFTSLLPIKNIDTDSIKVSYLSLELNLFPVPRVQVVEVLDGVHMMPSTCTIETDTWRSKLTVSFSTTRLYKTPISFSLK